MVHDPSSWCFHQSYNHIGPVGYHGFSMVFLGMRCIPGLHPLPDPYFCQAPDGSCLAGAMGHHNLTGSLEGSENPWKSNVFSSFFPLKQAWHVEKSPFCSALRLPLHGATLQSLGARSKSVVRGPRVLPELRHNRGGHGAAGYAAFGMFWTSSQLVSASSHRSCT